MRSNPVLFYVGVPKSGSSSLTQIFNDSGSIRRFRWPDLVRGGINEERAKLIYSAFIQLDEADTDIPHIRRSFEAVRQEAADAGKTLVWADVNFVTSPFPTEALRRLHRLCPEARVMVSIREQAAAILSIYRSQAFYLRSVPDKLTRVRLSFREWAEFVLSNHTGERAMGNLSHHQEAQYLRIADYSRLHDILKRAFEGKPITYAPLELLKADPGAYFATVYGAIGQKINPDITDNYRVIGSNQTSMANR